MRFLFAIARGLLRPRPAGSLAPHVLHGRVGLLDLDVNLHANNASVVYLTELARWEWLAASGLLGVALRNRWTFLLGSQAVRYRREMKAFSPYRLETTILAMDDSWLWLGCQIACPAGSHGEAVQCARSLHRVLVKSRGRTVPPKTVLEALNAQRELLPDLPRPEQVKEIQGFLQWDSAVKESMG
jgi:acyl-CoA thioesterase FadM